MTPPGSGAADVAGRTPRRGRRDGNHADIVGAFQATGCSVQETTDTGLDGFPDLVVGCMGVNHLVETKNPDTEYGRRGLSASQQRFNAGWRGEPMVAVSTVDEALDLVAKWRQRR